MEQHTHTKGPFKYGSTLLEPASAGKDNRWLHRVWSKKLAIIIAEVNWEPDADLIVRFQEVPHECDDSTCPGAENKRKLEAIDDLLAALKELGHATAPFISTAISSKNPVVIQAINLANAAIAKAEGTTR